MPSALQDETLERCPDCGLELPRQGVTRHPYLGASPSCWGLYNEVLAREYSSPALMASVHRLTVDAYAAQHPGKPERRTIQSIWVHLASLYLTLERGLAHDYARRVIGALTSQSNNLEWLTPPASLGSITVAQVAAAPDAASHEEIVRRWARDVWSAWQPYHPQIESLAARHAAASSH
jgi:Family of unknown function (DUF5946)